MARLGALVAFRARSYIPRPDNQRTMWRGPDGWSDRPMWNDPSAAPRTYTFRVRASGPFAFQSSRYRPGPTGMRFSRTEVTQLFHSVVVLTLAFGIVFAREVRGSIDAAILPYTVALALPAVLSGFVLHEMGHKFMAQRYGAWSEYRAWYMGLLIALALSPWVLLAAPGAVMISGALRRSENGKISLAGPMTNFVIVLACTPAYMFLTVAHFGSIVGMDPDPDLGASGLAAGAVFYLVWVNVLLAAFNLLPIPPFDGSKVARWNPGIWFLAFFAVFVTGNALAGV